MSAARWTRSARSDLAAIDDHYARLDPRYALRIGREAIAAARARAARPGMGAPIDPYGLRKWRVGRSPYILLYRPVAGGVEIVRVRHAAQDWRAP